MHAKILSNCVFTIICITIQATIFASIISSYVDTCYTATFRSLICIFIYIKFKATNSFILSLSIQCACHIVIYENHQFPAHVSIYIILSGYLYKSLQQFFLHLISIFHNIKRPNISLCIPI